MKCWNCLKEIPDDAKACQYCETLTDQAPTEEEATFVDDLLASMDDQTREELVAAMEGAGTAEEFVNRIMIGDCPNCGSSDVGDCDNDPAIENILLGRCYACGQLWCTDCEELLEPDATVCGHDAICDKCEEVDSCVSQALDCDRVVQWKTRKQA
ncbi:MAG: hypothetical protein HQ567_30000 [Candidatus Nealsonbacteria bacterium]|nr:hypothetical protein [Candidatus Nealsonbacteria bacterium]